MLSEFDMKTIYDSLFHNNPSIMLIINPKTGIIIDANESASDFYQYPREKMIGMAIADINMMNENEIHKEMLEAYQRRKSYFVFKHKLGNGEVKLVEVHSGPINLNGEILLYSIIQDITDRRKSELEILELNQELNTLVQRRTRELEKSNHALNEHKDILEQKLVQEMEAQIQVRSLYEEMADLYNNAPCGYHSIAPDGTIIHINDAELKWLGYTREEIAGKRKFVEFLTEESVEKFKLYYPQLREKGEIHDIEFEMIRKDGSKFTVLGNGSAIYDSNGNYVMSRSTLFDISERRAAQNALSALNASLEETIRERTQHLEEANDVLHHEIDVRMNVERNLNKQNALMDTLINMVNIGIIMLSCPDANVRFFNIPLTKQFKLDAQGAEALTFEALMALIFISEGNPYPKHSFPYEFAKNGMVSHIDDAITFDKNGHKKYLDIYAVPIFDSNGKVESVLMTITDISERKQFELHIQELNKQLIETNYMLEETNAELEETNAILEHTNTMLEETNAELEESNAMLESEISDKNRVQEELIIAKEVAENANAAKSNFLANMSHEIRTPMNGIIGMTELALMTNLDNDQQNYLMMVKKSANSLLRIINDVLDYTKIEVGKISLENSQFSLQELIDDTFSLFAVSASQKNINLSVEIDMNLPLQLYGDSLRLKQVLGNLIGNAVKFTERGNVEINVKLMEETTFYRTLKFTIVDTGIGIPEDKQSLLFERFSQIDSSYAKPFQGTGLGLAISKKLVELMGGDIWLDHSTESGSRFCFTVKLSENYRQQQNLNAIKNVIDQMPEPLERKIRILVVEDDEISRHAIVTFLKKQNYDILIAENGLEAIEITENNVVDIILMDVQMPLLDGFSATKAIRSNEKLNSVPIIAMTAYALTGDREKCLNAGMDDYVSKPINFEEIKFKIMQHVN